MPQGSSLNCIKDSLLSSIDEASASFIREFLGFPLNMVNINTKNIPFKELMEIINAKHGFYYSKDSRKKLNRYTGKVSRRIVRGSKGQPKKSGRVGRIFRALLS
jgi:hypothetical protein